MKEWGKLLGYCREKAGPSQTSMAKLTAYRQSYISMIEAGKRDVPNGLVEVYAKETGHPELVLLTTGVVSSQDVWEIIRARERADLAKEWAKQILGA